MMEPIRVLLVDDEVELVSTLAERMVIRDFDAKWAASSMEALKLAESHTFDVAVLDVKMPKISGLVLKEMLQEKYSQMKFIFLTGYGSEEEFKVITSQIGKEYYLVKPIDIETLISKIMDILQIENKDC